MRRSAAGGGCAAGDASFSDDDLKGLGFNGGQVKVLMNSLVKLGRADYRSVGTIGHVKCCLL